MAKSKSTGVAISDSGKYDDWAVRDAMHTMMRAGELTKDTKMMSLVRKEAARYAQESQAVANKAGALAKRGLISDKQMSKMSGKRAAARGNQGGSMKSLDKTAPIA